MQLTKITDKVKSLFQLKKSKEATERHNEIISLNRRLEEFAIAFSNLSDRSSTELTPTLLNISRTLAQDEEMLDALNVDKKLPIQQLLVKYAGVSRSVLEDHQAFIITMALIFSGPYPCLTEYVQIVRS